MSESDVIIFSHGDELMLQLTDEDSLSVTSISSDKHSTLPPILPFAKFGPEDKTDFHENIHVSDAEQNVTKPKVHVNSERKTYTCKPDGDSAVTAPPCNEKQEPYGDIDKILQEFSFLETDCNEIDNLNINCHSDFQEEKSKSCEKNIGKVKKRNRPPPFLPPCKVCGDKSSGIHYSVSTCEPCKGFFRRSILKESQQKQLYKCAGSGNCIFGPENRQTCSYCRYKRCIDAGMSVSSKKSGRYTYEKRTQITLEVKKIEQAEREFRNLHVQEEQAEETIDILVQIQRKVNPKLVDYIQGNLDMSGEQADVFNAYMRKLELFGKMAALPVEIYEDFYKTTGIDIDNRQDLMKKVVVRIERTIRHVIEFMRAIPGINKLSMADQTALVKASHFEFGFLGVFHGMNAELNVLTGDGIKVHRDEVSSVFDNAFLDDVFLCASKMKSLKLSEEEIALCRGICICFSDRCSLQEPEKVEDIQWTLVNCLRFYAKSKGYNPDQRLCQIFDRLTSLRGVSDLCQKLDEEKTKWPATKENPLVMDVLS